jgi:aminopeptidase
METFDARIRVICDPNTKALSSFDPDKIVMRRKAEGPLMRTLMQRTAAGSLRWTVALFPTHGHAQNAEMSTTEFEEFVYRACQMRTIPSAIEEGISKEDRIIQWLKGKESARHRPRTDLRMSVAAELSKPRRPHEHADGEAFTAR